jgi:hypothetical protein
MHPIRPRVAWISHPDHLHSSKTSFAWITIEWSFRKYVKFHTLRAGIPIISLTVAEFVQSIRHEGGAEWEKQDLVTQYWRSSNFFNARLTTMQIHFISFPPFWGYFVWFSNGRYSGKLILSR